MPDLLEPLDFNQGSPIGFLVLEKLLSEVFGRSEYSLRLIPLVAGIASLLIFVRVARQILPSTAVPLAVGLFAVSDGAIYYSSEVKQYSCDVFATLVLTALALSLLTQPSRKRMLAVAAVGGGVILVSYAAILVAPSLAIVSVVGTRRVRGRLESTFVIPAVTWILVSAGSAALAGYQLSHLRQTFNAAPQAPSPAFGSASQAPSPAFGSASLTPGDLGVGFTHFVSAIASDLGQPRQGAFIWIGYLFVGLACIGVMVLWRRDPTATAIIVAPIVTTGAVVAGGEYPLLSRTILFLVPGFILLASSAVHFVGSANNMRRVVAAAAFAIVVSVWPSQIAVSHLLHPRHFQEIKGALSYLCDHWRSGDALYLHYASQYAFAYYGECNCFDMSSNGRPWPMRESRFASPGQFAPAITSAPPVLYVGPYRGRVWSKYLQDLHRVSGRRRVWFLFTHASDKEEAAFQDITMPAYLESIGKQRFRYTRGGARLYLYDVTAARYGAVGASDLVFPSRVVSRGVEDVANRRSCEKR
jgi:hypothetical protein